MSGAAFTLGGRPVDEDRAPLVIAEISANHRGSLNAALELVAAAAESGADAVKFQHYRAETLTVRSVLPEFTVRGGTLWDGQQLVDLYAEAQTPWEWTAELVAAASALGLVWLSSPFDAEAVDFLDELDVPAIKIASFELVDLPLIRYAAAKGRPLLMSTGMATIDEIDAAVTAARASGAPEIALLRCNSAYPAPPEAMDLRAIPAIEGALGTPGRSLRPHPRRDLSGGCGRARSDHRGEAPDHAPLRRWAGCRLLRGASRARRPRRRGP